MFYTVQRKCVPIDASLMSPLTIIKIIFIYLIVCVLAEQPQLDYQLSNSLIPLNYFLRIRPIFHQSQLDNDTTDEMDTAPGFVRIQLFCAYPTNSIVLHQKYLQINESSVFVKRLAVPGDNDLLASPQHSESIPVSSVGYDETKDFVMFNATQQLEPGTLYEIEMEFVAPVPQNSTLDGLYSIHYQMIGVSVAIPERSMVVTSFEPLGARQAFPCLDEPIYRATYDIVIGRTENFTSLSNGPLVKSEPDPNRPGWFWDTFQTTVKLPTYLVAFTVISEFSFTEASSQLYRLPVRVYGPKEWISQGDDAQLVANFTAMLLSHYEQKFGQQFNMPKLDSLWVPGKTAALECHGLILYGNQMLVMKEDGVTDLGHIVFNRNAVSHEIAHIFFGNMVGSSWAEVWLKEGITTYMSYVGTSAIWPELDQMRHMIYEVISTALETDVRNGTHPMRHEAHTNKEIGRNMGIIGYDKGASLVKMLVGFLGEDAFYKGIRQYLAEFHDLVATQEDFFEKLNEAVEEERISLPAHVKEIMTPWTDQEGFPLVKVTWVEPGRVILSQERFENDEMRRIENASSSDEVFWDIPVRYVVIRENGVKHQNFVWLRKDGKSVELAINGSGEWTLLVNSDGAGYFRVLYDEEHLLPRIVRQLIVNHSVFTVEARARLLDDQLNLALQKYIPIQTAMEFTRYLGQETNPTVWFCVLHKLLKIFYLFRPLVKGLQTREDYIALKESLLLHMPQQRSSSNVDSNITAVNFFQIENDELTVPLTISILEHELIQRLKLNGLDDQDFKAFKGYLLPRINSTLVGIAIASNSENDQNRFPGSQNFSLSSVGILESFMIDWSCSLQSDWCMQYILRQMTDWFGQQHDGIGNVSEVISTPNPIPTDIQASLYCHMVHWLGEVAFKWIFAKAQGINDTTQETWLTVALGCAQENNSFSNILNMLTASGHADYNLNSNSSSTHFSTLPQPETINKVYAKSLYSKIMQHSEIGTIFITLLFTILLPESEYLSYFHFTPGYSATEISELFGYSQDCLWTEFHLEMIQDLVASNPEFYGDSLNLTISSIQSNMQWMSEFRENLTSWFRESV